MALPIFIGEKMAKHILSCSFGKDSIATALLALQHGEPLDELEHGFATSIDSLNPVNPSPVFAGSTGKTGIDIIQNNIALNHLGKMVDFNFHCGLL